MKHEYDRSDENRAWNRRPSLPRFPYSSRVEAADLGHIFGGYFSKFNGELFDIEVRINFVNYEGDEDLKVGYNLLRGENNEEKFKKRIPLNEGFNALGTIELRRGDEVRFLTEPEVAEGTIHGVFINFEVKRRA